MLRFVSLSADLHELRSSPQAGKPDLSLALGALALRDTVSGMWQRYLGTDLNTFIWTPHQGKEARRYVWCPVGPEADNGGRGLEVGCHRQESGWCRGRSCDGAKPGSVGVWERGRWC